MVKIGEVKEKYFLAAVVLAILLFFAPFLKDPKLLTTRDNDFGRNYIPIISFFRDSFYIHDQIPLWRPDQMMGETFVGNPISSIFYPANLFFLIKNSHYAAIIYLIYHIIFAAISTFFLSKSFKLSSSASVAAAIFYALSFKMTAHVEAGHLTMIAAASYIPLTLLSVRNLLSNRDHKWQVIGAFSMAFMFFTYPTIFYYTIIFLTFYWIYHEFPTFTIKKQLPLILLFITTFGLSAIVLFPQLEFAPLSTRSSLKLEDVAQPLWNFKMFTQSLIFPYKILDQLNHEAFLYLGIVPSILATIGFFKLSFKGKITLVVFAVLAILFAAGTSTPIFALVYDYVPFLKYSRITTRFWFIIALIAALLAAYILNNIKSKILIYLVALLFLIEVTIVFHHRIDKIPDLSFENESLYQHLLTDPERFRVYCTTHCLNGQLVSKYRLQILDGENPIQDSSFVEFLQKAGNYKWDQFAVIFPPYQIWQVEHPPTPNSEILAKVNVKYVASTYRLADKELEYIDTFDKIFLYKNKSNLKRAFFQDDNQPIDIAVYSPNRILLKFQPEPVVRKLIIADNYFPGWFAYINFEKHQVLPTDNQSRLVIVPENAGEVELKFQPQSFQFGKTITITTLIVMFMWYIRKKHD